MKPAAADLGVIRALYPFESRFLPVWHGARMHYLDEGTGPAVVMLHGNPTWSFYYRNMVLGLRDRCRVVAPDHLGCGLSDKPQDAPYTLTAHIDNLERLLDHLGLGEVTLMVHDWGGAIGFGWAARHPERVRRFIVLNTAAFFGRVPWRIRVCRVPGLGAWAVRRWNLFALAALRMACKSGRCAADPVRAGYLLPYPDHAGRIAIHRFVQDIPTRPAHPTYALIQSIEAALPQLRDHPMLICWGMRDFCFTERFLEGWLERFPHAEAHRFREAGHYVLEDAGEEILPLVREFLDSTHSESVPEA